MPRALGHAWWSPRSRRPRLIERCWRRRIVGRLNLGALPTTQIGWDQPHEGNLFDHLYARRASSVGVAQDAAGD